MSPGQEAKKPSNICMPYYQFPNQLREKGFSILYCDLYVLLILKGVNKIDRRYNKKKNDTSQKGVIGLILFDI